ncbi:FAD-dependent oxidoreductase, partial [Marinospirillum sp.]|uniref:FAD-dependent oxidoreductase n=1 Tax=Marinospirillum sp. TaxID=2183934 RepID=UPI003A87A448
MQNRLTYDVVVIGGGLVGASLALALRPLKLKVAVLEAQPPELDAVPDAAVAHRWQPSFDARSSALAWGTRQLYQRLGLWEAIAPHAYPIRHIEVSERGRLGTSHLTAAEQQVEALGYVVPNTWLGQHLWCALQASEVDLYTPCELQQLRFPSAEQAELEAQGPEGRFTLGARLVILADGGRSGIKQQLGIVDDVHDYQQSALIANLRL